MTLDLDSLKGFREARIRAGLSYREVARAAGLHPSAIAHGEAGRLRLSAPARERLEKALKALLLERIQRTVAVLHSL